LDAIETKPIVSRAKAYLKVRHAAVRKAMKELKLDGLLLTHPPDLAYLTNFTGEDSVGLITEKDFLLATDFRYQEQVAMEAGWLKVHLREAKMSDVLGKMLTDTKTKRVGFEANFTTVGQIDALQTALKGKTPVELVPLDNVMVNIRKVKDDRGRSL
jgi:Xaa-Pro aminopeptidase